MPTSIPISPPTIPETEAFSSGGPREKRCPGRQRSLIRKPPPNFSISRAPKWVSEFWGCPDDPAGSRAARQPSQRQVLNLDGIRNFSALLVTLATWTCFFYVPRHPISGKGERIFNLGVRSQISTRLGGYLAYREQRRSDSAESERLIRLFRRFPRQIDIMISRYGVGTSYLKGFDVRTHSWPGTKVALFYKINNPYAGAAFC
jgi:hypothetical protein